MSEDFKVIGLIDYVCPYCGHNKSYKKIYLDCTEYGVCESCEKITYKIFLKDPYAPPVIKCPYCNSTNTKKISTLSKAGSVALWGVFALGKASKEWHCNNCKSDF